MFSVKQIIKHKIIEAEAVVIHVYHDGVNLDIMWMDSMETVTVEAADFEVLS